jgi:hypothetical protein
MQTSHPPSPGCGNPQQVDDGRSVKSYGSFRQTLRGVVIMNQTIRILLHILLGLVTMAVGIAFAAAVAALVSIFTPMPNHSPAALASEGYDFFSPARVETPPPPQKAELSCYDHYILPIWQELKKDKDFVDRLHAMDGTLNCSDMLEIKAIDLNRDGRSEFLVRGKDFQFCGATGNCKFWAFEKRGAQAQILLSATDYGEKTQLGDQVQRSRAGGYANLLLKGHFTAAETSYTTYRFDGKRYVESRCMYEVPKHTRDGEGSMELITCEEFRRRSENLRSANEAPKVRR